MPLTTLGVLATSAVLFTACAGGKEEPRPPTQTVAPTAAVTNTPSGARPTAAATQPTGGQAGDPKKGQDLFVKLGCSGCHATTANKIVGPGLGGIKGKAATRVAGISAEAYIEQSIRDPNAYVVEGFPPSVMPATFGTLSAEEVKNLIAYLESL